MRLSLKPADTFFFRDGKPFSRGEQTEAEGIFPPMPSTVFGALRTAFISEKGWNVFENNGLKDAIGTKESYDDASLRLRGVFLGNEDIGALFPLPMDLVQEKYNKDKAYLNILNKDSDEIISNSPLPRSLTNYLGPDVKVKYPHGDSLSIPYMIKYLQGQNEGFIPISKADCIKREPKVGIARDGRSLTTREGNLYRVDMMRFEDGFQLIVDIEGLDINKGLLKLGGENKPFLYEESKREFLDLEDEERKEIIDKIEKSKRFKLYFATPAIFRKGWLPDWIRQDTLEGKHNGIEMKLLTCSTGRYQNVGGWDMYKKRPKTMYRAVPAGSVYYFEILKGKAEEVFDILHYQNISDLNSQAGFGLVFVGAIYGGKACC